MSNVNYKIYNRLYQEVAPASGYCLPFDKFRFIADFSSTNNSISDKKVIWNFGDGTTSIDLTAQHSFSYPGIYPVTLTVFNSGGNGTISTYLSSVKILNAVNDALVMTSNANVILRSGQANSPIYLTRYNSAQTTISGDNKIISLAVSGNRSPFFDKNEYETNKYAHLESSAKFIIQTDLWLTVVDTITTTNDPLYALPSTSNTSISLTTSGYSSTYLAGSSGYAVFYYVEDSKI